MKLRQIIFGSMTLLVACTKQTVTDYRSANGIESDSSESSTTSDLRTESANGVTDSPGQILRQPQSIQAATPLPGTSNQDGRADQNTSEISCDELKAVEGKMDANATPILTACLARVASGGIINIPKGVYVFHQRMPAIEKAVELRTTGFAYSDDTICDPRGAHNCATFKVHPAASDFDPVNEGKYFFTLQAQGIKIHHIAFDMGLNSPGILLNPQSHDARLKGNALSLARRTALVVAQGVQRPIVEKNLIYNNGTHADGKLSDGLTVHDAANAQIVGNYFLDNTDVQLLFGGCVNCEVKDNQFSHTGDRARSSFAEIGIYAWPHTPGNFSGSNIRGNNIDCSAGRSCWIGIYIGNYSWHGAETNPPPVQGGSIDGNRIVNAQWGMYVDHAVGTIIGNNNAFHIPAGGPWGSGCGRSYGSATVVLADQPTPGGIIQIGIGSTAPALYPAHTVINDFRGCIGNWY